MSVDSTCTSQQERPGFESVWRLHDVRMFAFPMCAPTKCIAVILCICLFVNPVTGPRSLKASSPMNPCDP